MSGFTVPGQMLGKRYQLTTEFPDQLPYEGVDVWNAIDTMLGTSVRIVAISPDSPFAHDALDAARRSSLIDDPHVVQILSVGEDAEARYVVTELPLGSPLSSHMHGVPFPAEQARAIIGEVASALNAARTRGVRHLQLNSSVVRVGTMGEVFVDGLGMNAALAGIHPDSLHGAEADRLEAQGLCLLLAQLLTGEPLPDPSLLSVVAQTENIPDALRNMCAREVENVGPSSTADVVRELAPWGAVVFSDFPQMRESFGKLGVSQGGNESTDGSWAGLSPQESEKFPKEVVADISEDFLGKNEAVDSGVTEVDPLSDEVLSPSGLRPQWASLDEFAQEHPEEVDPAATAIFRVEEIEAEELKATEAAGSESAGVDLSEVSAVAGGISPVTNTTVASEETDVVASQADINDESSRDISVQEAGHPHHEDRTMAGVNPGLFDNQVSPVSSPTSHAVPPVSLVASDSHAFSPSEGSKVVEETKPQEGLSTRDSSLRESDEPTRGDTGRTFDDTNPAWSRTIQSVPSITPLSSGEFAASDEAHGPFEGTEKRASIGSSSAKRATSLLTSSTSPTLPNATGGQNTAGKTERNTYSERKVPPVPSIPESELAGEVVPPKKYSSSKVVVLGAVLSLVLMGAWAFKTFFSPTSIPERSPSRPVASSTEPSSDGSTVPSEDLSALPAPSIAGITILNPYASGLKDPADSQDNPKMLPFLTDGKDATYWQTWYYPDASFGGTKKGVGLAIKLSERSRVTSVTLSSPLTGGTIQWRASSTDSPDSGEVLAEASLGGTTTLTAPQAQGSDTVILWFPALSPVENTFRIRVSEISVQ